MASATVTQTPSQSLIIEDYQPQMKKYWPKEGRHILAQYDDSSVVVYQAYKHEIAKYAVEHQRFGGDHFSFDRMSWVKTNFLWMMYRCGWASKKDQQRVLAVRITREGFDTILENALTPQVQERLKVAKDNVQVRLQWDPDHTPTFKNCTRRAIQLGLKGQILHKYGTDWIVSIEDITDFVHKQAKVIKARGEEELKMPQERVYNITNQTVAERIGVDQCQL